MSVRLCRGGDTAQRNAAAMTTCSRVHLIEVSLARFGYGSLHHIRAIITRRRAACGRSEATTVPIRAAAE